jgi:hypothetical protein
MAIRAHLVNDRIDRTLSKRPPEPTPVPEIEQPAVDLGKILQRTTLAPNSLRSAELLHLQRTLGNRAVEAILARSAVSPPLIQAKLTVTAPGDEYEQEADRVALRREEQVRTSAREPLSPSSVQRQHRRESENTTGLPDHLKAGIETLSGLSLDDVKVHYNSSKPAQVEALTYTQGTDIYVGPPGQEKHLAHEAWHVVQQKQGRVRPTLQMRDGVAINDDAGLEKEADVMGEKLAHEKQELIAHELTHVVQQGGVKTKSIGDKRGRIAAERSRITSGITMCNDLAKSTIQRKGIGGPKIAIVREENFLDDGKRNQFIKEWRIAKGRRRGAKRDVTNKVEEYSRYYLANQNKQKNKAKSYSEEWEWEQHKARAALVNAPPDSLTDYYANSLMSLDGDKEALKKYLQSSGDMEFSEENDGCYVVVKNEEKRTKIAKIYEGDEAYEKVPPDIEDMWAERVRPRYRKKGYRGEDESKQYVKDSRNVLTRRYAYVEKNYWQMMEFFMLNHMEGRFQQLMRAAGLEKPRGEIPLTKKSKKWRSQEYEGDLSMTQMAVLHQASGSSDEQRGVSMTSTPKVGITYVNTGENFRTAKGFRLKIDLSLVPEDEALLLNHYADGGIAGISGAARDFDTKRYKYNESALHARELYLKFLKPEWVVGIEYHKSATENIPTEMRQVRHKKQWEELKEEHGANEYEDGFGTALKFDGRERKWKDKKSQAWQEGFSSGATVCAGYDAGWQRKLVLEKEGNIPSDEDEKLAYMYETMVEDTAKVKRAAISQYQVGYLRGILGLPQFNTIEDYKNALKRK